METRAGTKDRGGPWRLFVLLAGIVSLGLVHGPLIGAVSQRGPLMQYFSKVSPGCTAGPRALPYVRRRLAAVRRAGNFGGIARGFGTREYLALNLVRAILEPNYILLVPTPTNHEPPPQ